MGLFRRSTPPPDPAELAQVRADLCSLQAALGSLDERVTAVSTELANQLTELGHDIDGSHERQVKLANEQARYQIAFREDLARLVEDVTRRR